MGWMYVALLAPAFWALGNHIDKYLLDKQLDRRGVGSLMLFSALIGLPVMALILLLHPDVLRITVLDAGIMILNGILYVLGLLPYFYALKKDEASIVVPLFQTTAVFSYALGLLILGEQLTFWQLSAALLIICGSLMVTLDLRQQGSKLKAEVLALMLLASLLNALNWLLFKFVAIRENFWVSSFWEYAGFVTIGIFMLAGVTSYRREFMLVLQQSKFNILGLVALNETVSLAAKIATNLASLLAPIALIATVHGLQPFFVFIYGVLLTLYLPRFGSERLGTRIVLQKVMAMALMIAGTSLLAVL